MKKLTPKYLIYVLIFCLFTGASAQIEREFEIKVTDSGLYFDGEARKSDFSIDNEGFEYFFGRRITPHGDCIKKYGDFLFLSWYLGGEENKNVMLSRLHIPSQTLETVKFPHTHVGYQHKYPHIGDSHNTIAVAVCPLDSTVHMLYDMHSYSKADFPDSYFNYSVSFNGAANAPVGEFTLDLFKPRQTYLNPSYNYSDITYPNFFLNNNDELFVWFREGGNNNGMYKFAKYSDGAWGPFTNFSTLNAKSQGNPYNWGLYGDLKYINGKLRVGFLKRMSYNDDKYVYNNGFHYAYTDDPEGKTQWYNYKGDAFSLPLVKPEKIFFYEPGDVVTQGGANSIKISSGANFTVTDKEAVHFITNGVKSMVDGKSKNVHAYKKAGDSTFTISTDFPGGSLEAVDGNQVFLVSKNNDRVEIYKAEGGTNDWEKLYTETTGIKIEHNNVLIADGKMFVYAMQKASGDARPIYIQMYDLGILPPDTTRTLAFANVTDGQEIAKGTNLTIEAEVGSAYTEVSLWSGNTNLGTLTEAPYQWSSHPILTNMTDRVYAFSLVAKDEAGAETEESITIYTPEDNSLASQTSIYISFEDEAIANWETDGNDYGVVPEITDGINVRAGAKVLKMSYSDRTSGHHIQNIVDKIAVPNNHYFHMIAYTATSDNGYGQSFPTAKLGEWKPTPSFTGHASNDVFERKVTSRQNTQGDTLNCFPRVRNKANGGACDIYYDDIVLYTSPDEDVDLTAPSAAAEVEVNGDTLSWVEGSDEATGIVETLILATTNFSAAAPEMQAQVAYGTLGQDSIGDWEVLAKYSVGISQCTVHSDATMPYNYAVVHRDVAYNYSVPALYNEEVATLEERLSVSFKCYTLDGAIKLEMMKVGRPIAVYNISGQKVYEGMAKETEQYITLAQGIYLVKVGEEVQKALVK